MSILLVGDRGWIHTNWAGKHRWWTVHYATWERVGAASFMGCKIDCYGGMSKGITFL